MRQYQKQISSIRSSDKSIDDNKPAAKRKRPACMAKDSTRNKGHMAEMIGDRLHRKNV